MMFLVAICTVDEIADDIDKTAIIGLIGLWVTSSCSMVADGAAMADTLPQ